MINESPFSFEKFHRQHETPVFEFVLARLGRNWHLASGSPANTDEIALEIPGDPSQQLQDAAAEITVEVFVQMYRVCSHENLLEGNKTITDDKRDQLRDGLYKTVAWLCDSP